MYTVPGSELLRKGERNGRMRREERVSECVSVLGSEGKSEGKCAWTCVRVFE